MQKDPLCVMARAFEIEWAVTHRAGDVGARFAAGLALAARPLVVARQLFEPTGNANSIVVLLADQLFQTKTTGGINRIVYNITSDIVIRRGCNSMVRSSGLLAAVAVDRRVRSCSWAAAPATR